MITGYSNVISVTTLDADVVAFFDRVTTAGGSLSTTEKSAIETLVADLKDYGIWTKMKAIYPMVGASAAACAQNLKSSSFTNSFSGGWTFSSTGARPNGTNAFYNTLLNVSVELSQNNISMGIYSGGTTGSLSNVAMGANSSVAFTRLYPNDANIIYVDLNDGSTTFLSAASRSDGFIFGYRVSATQKKISRRGTIFSFNETSTGIPNHNIFLGATNSNGSAGLFSSFEHRYTFIGETISDTQAAAYYTAVQAFQTTLSRQV